MRMMPVSREVWGKKCQRSGKREEEVKILQVEKIQERKRIKRPEFEKKRKGQPTQGIFFFRLGFSTLHFTYPSTLS
jgi:hypothetical protein